MTWRTRPVQLILYLVPAQVRVNELSGQGSFPFGFEASLTYVYAQNTNEAADGRIGSDIDPMMRVRVRLGLKRGPNIDAADSASPIMLSKAVHRVQHRVLYEVRRRVDSSINTNGFNLAILNFDQLL